MHKSIIALGIESSCDDTSIGVIRVARRVIYWFQKNWDMTLSQEIYKDYGGVMPEIAARAHSEEWMHF